MLGWRPKEGRGLMFKVERGRRAQQPRRECAGVGVEGRDTQSHLEPKARLAPRRVPSPPEYGQGQALC